MSKINVINGDITKLDNIDVIVNAANKRLMGGGGVDRAIHFAAGKELAQECKNLAPCETGECVITKAYNLPYKNIIHTVGPIYYEENWAKEHNYNQEELLSNCYKNSLQLAYINGLYRIAFPSISTGAYCYPIEKACKIAIDTVGEFLSKHKEMEVTFVLYEEDDYFYYKKELESKLEC